MDEGYQKTVVSEKALAVKRFSANKRDASTTDVSAPPTAMQRCSKGCEESKLEEEPAGVPQQELAVRRRSKPQPAPAERGKYPIWLALLSQKFEARR